MLDKLIFLLYYIDDKKRFRKNLSNAERVSPMNSEEIQFNMGHRVAK